LALTKKEEQSMALKAEIGETAGQIYRLLSSDGPLTPAQLKNNLHAKGDVVSYALGWLAREDKIDFVLEKKTLRVQVK
jgi:hypothetical protein